MFSPKNIGSWRSKRSIQMDDKLGIFIHQALGFGLQSCFINDQIEPILAIRILDGFFQLRIGVVGIMIFGFSILPFRWWSIEFDATLCTTSRIIFLFLLGFNVVIKPIGPLANAPNVEGHKLAVFWSRTVENSPWNISSQIQNSMQNPYLMVNGCHSCLAIVGIFMKAQSPGEYLNPSGRLICNVVTLQDNRKNNQRWFGSDQN